jgi:hypothetical protein
MHTSQAIDMGSRDIWPSRHFTGQGLGWELYDYHGCKVIGHEGGTDGMLTRIVMVPDEDFGFVILTNSISALPMALEYYILDQYFQGKSYDWSAILFENSLNYQEGIKKAWADYLASTDRSLSPSLDLSGYCGTYSCKLYGDVEVSRGEGNPTGEGGPHKEKLILDFLPSQRLIGDLSVFSRDTFLIDLRDNEFFPQGTVKFYLDENGRAERLEVDIPNPDFDFTELKLKKIN